MATLALKHHETEVEFEVRESDKYSKKVLVRMTRFTPDGERHIDDLFLDPRQVIALGDFLRYEGVEIEVDQAHAEYEAEADAQSTR